MSKVKKLSSMEDAWNKWWEKEGEPDASGSDKWFAKRVFEAGYRACIEDLKVAADKYADSKPRR